MNAVYLRQNDAYVALHEIPYDAESVLQGLIAQHPEFLTPDPARGLLLVRREAPVSTGTDGSGARLNLDHLYLDADGIPTLVEVKRSSDTRARREVVAQMLDYAANARASFGEGLIRVWVEERARRSGLTVEELLADNLGVDDPDEFWRQVSEHLDAQRFRLLFVADSISIELRTIIEFLNGQMETTEVLAIEVKQYVDPAGNHQTIVPRVIGDVVNVPASKRRQPKLDRTTLLGALADHSENEATAGAAVLEWIGAHPSLELRWSKAADAVAETPRGRRNVLRVWPYGGIEIHLKNLELLGEQWDWKDSSELMQALDEIGGLAFTSTERRWPKSPIAPLADAVRRGEFFRLVGDALERL